MDSFGGMDSSFSGLRQLLCPTVDVPCRLLLSGFQVARVIGKGGAFIKELRESSGAVINILDKQLPVAFMNRDERVVLVRGSLESIMIAVGGIIRLAFGASSPTSGHDVTVEEHQRAVEVMIPEVSCSHLIGEKGTRISSIMQETRCDLHVVREPVSGLSEQKRLRIMGPAVPDIELAVFKVQELMLDLTKFGVLSEAHFNLVDGPTAAVDLAPRDRGKGSGIAVHMLVGKDETAWIIGKRGSKISKLRDLARVSVNDADIPPFTQHEAVVEIAGAPLSELIHVLQLIVDDLMLKPGARDTTRLMLPTEHFAAIIGQGGEVIRRLGEETGATLSQQPAERHGSGLYRLRVLEVTGNDRQRIAAAKAAFEIVEEACIKAGTLERAAPVHAPPLFASSAESPPPTPSPSPSAAERAAAVGAAVARPSFAEAPPPPSAAEGFRAATVPPPSQQATSAVPDERLLRPSSACESSSASFAAAPQRPASTLVAPSTACSPGAASRAASASAVRASSSSSAAAASASAALAPPPRSASVGRAPPMGADRGAASALTLLLPSRMAAQFVASNELAVWRRTGAKVSAASGPLGEPLLRVEGTPAAIGSACYMVQEALWMCGAYSGTMPGGFCGSLAAASPFVASASGFWRPFF